MSFQKPTEQSKFLYNSVYYSFHKPALLDAYGYY